MLHCKPLRFGAAIAQGGAGSKPLTPGDSACGQVCQRPESPMVSHCHQCGHPTRRYLGAALLFFRAMILRTSTRREKAIAK